MVKRLLGLSMVLVLAGCAGYAGRGLVVGVANRQDVLSVMGEPARLWIDADGSRRLAYPRGPQGVHTYMVDIGPDGTLRDMDNVMQPKSFALIQPNMTSDSVLRVLGPSVEAWTEYFKARDELVLGWRYCDDWNELARFYVLFDGATGTVRSTMTQTEAQARVFGDEGMGNGCSR